MVTKQRLTTTALGALLLAGFLLALLFPAPASAIPLEQAATATFTPTFTPTITSTPGPYPNTFFTPPPTTCPASANFRAGDTVALVGGVVIRYGPNPSSPFLVTFEDNRLFTVLEGGPLCVEGYNWYPITGHGITGWVSEGTRDGLRYWLTLQRRATDPAIACLTPLNLVEGNRFNINVNVRLRAMPSISSLTITVVPYTATVTVLDGPVCNEGYNWWWVRTTVVDFVYEGWLAESARAAGSEPFVVVPRQPDCHAPLRMDIGEQARVIYNDENPKRLRSAPTVNGGIIAELIENVPILIIGGPICADSYNWWNVRVLSSTPFEGWLAEGGPANWWIAPISEFRR